MILTFCCTIAWRVEVHRLITVNKKQLLEKSDEIIQSILWLVLQFCLLGLMEGFVVDKLDKYISHHFPK